MSTLIIIITTLSVLLFLNRRFISGLIAANRKPAISASEFKKTVNNHFKSKVTELGFIGKDWAYNKEKSGFIYSISFVTSKHGGEFAIDLTVRPKRIDKYKNLTNNEPSFSKRLTPSNQIDYWWRFKKNETENAKLLDKIFLLISSKGLEWFGKFNEFPTQFSNLTIEHLQDTGKLAKMFDTDYESKLHWTLALINVNEELNEKEKVKSFAEFGLKQIEGIAGLDWKPYFEEKQHTTGSFASAGGDE
jgi:hypothetical protein